MATKWKTERLDTPDKLLDQSEPGRFDLGFVFPWRIGLTIRSSMVQLFIQLDSPITIGRMAPNTSSQPDLDLGPFGAQQLGVSRCHVSLARVDNQIVVTDQHSLNGTILNGHRLTPGEAYPIHHGDELILGRFELTIALLVNPLP